MRCEERGFYLHCQRLVQDTDFSITINQNSYTSSITEIILPIEITKDKTSFPSKLGCWYSRTVNSFSACETGTELKNGTIKDVLYVNKIIKKVTSINYSIKFPLLIIDDLKL